MVKSPRELCGTPAHRVLWFTITLLLTAILIALGSHQTGMEIVAIIGLACIITVVILICLLDLRFEVEHHDKAAWNNMGFKTCKFLCWEKFSWAIFVSWSLILMLAGFLCLSGGLAMYVRYGIYIRDQFWGFMVEVTMMSVLTAIPIVLISWNRGGQALELAIEVGVISGKFGGLHILLEMCGFYAHVFSEHGEPLQRLSIAGPSLDTMNATELHALLDEQIVRIHVDGNTNEQIFLRMLVCVFVLTFLLSAIVLIRGKFRQDEAQNPAPGAELTEKQQRKLHAKAQLGARMIAMLVLSVILGGFMMLVLLLGLRSDDDLANNDTVEKVAETWEKIGSAGIIAALALSVGAICLVAVRTRFAGFINASPWTFVAELCLVIILSVLPLGYVSYNRGNTHTDVAIQIGVLCLKFGGIHLLLELSGFYATAMGGHYRQDIIKKLRRVGDPVARGSTAEPPKEH